MKSEVSLKRKLERAIAKKNKRHDKYQTYLNKLEESGLDWTMFETIKHDSLNAKLEKAISHVERCRVELNEFYKHHHSDK